MEVKEKRTKAWIIMVIDGQRKDLQRYIRDPRCCPLTVIRCTGLMHDSWTAGSKFQAEAVLKPKRIYVSYFVSKLCIELTIMSLFAFSSTRNIRFQLLRAMY